MKLFTVILHYGPVERTASLHRQLLAADPEEDILVFDNASPEAYSGAWERSGRNLYWAGAFERVMQSLAEQGASHVWFLNNDLCFVTKAPLIGRARVRLGRAERLVGRVGVYSPAATSNPYHPQMVERPGGQFSQVRYVDGIAPLISVEFWRRAGGIDLGGNPFGYGVDVWFSSRTREHGFSCVVDHQVVVRHAYHSTAREVDGFLVRAAEAESVYLAERLGPEYRRVVAQMASEVGEFG
jgi:hypothetical protein